MRRWLFMLFFLVQFAEAQVPTPELCAVTVDSVSGKPLLFWHIADTSAIDGFIIKRVIWDGQGVVDGTLNNVAVLPDPSLNSFLDTTTTYNTEAKPWLRQEQYVITAYKQQDSSVIYSGFSQRKSTIFLQAQYDSCKSRIHLQWSDVQLPSYTVVQILPQRKVVAHTSSNSFDYSPQGVGMYEFYIAAPVKGCLIDSVVSNVARVAIDFTQAPLVAQIRGISAQGEQSIALDLRLQLPAHAPVVELVRDSTVIAVFSSDFSGKWFDTVDVRTLHSYWLRFKSVCNVYFDSTQAKQNIVVRSQLIDKPVEKQIALMWNRACPCVGRYQVYFSEDSTNFQLLTQTSDTFFVHTLPLGANVYPSRFWYFVRFISQGADSGIFQSNLETVRLPALIFYPNTINPTSANEQDRQFRVYANFVDWFELRIFDRNAHLIFQTNDINQPWNGRDLSGNLVPVGTYLFVLRYKSYGQIHVIRGSITVLY